MANANMPRTRSRRPATAPFLETVDEHFGVRVMSAKLVPAAAQHGAELGVVVDLAVEHHPDIARLVGHRLERRDAEIHDREPNVPKVDIGSVRAGHAVGAELEAAAVESAGGDTKPIGAAVAQ